MTSLSPELVVLALGVVLFFAHMGVAGMLSTRDRGSEWNVGPRDGTPPPLGPQAGRAARAYANFNETFPVFAALALALAVTQLSGGIGTLGAWVWLAARVVYLPLYLAGTPYVRSLVFVVSVVGILMMLARLVF